MTRRATWVCWLFVTALLLILVPSVTAQAPVKERHLVYKLYSFDGRGYRQTFCPQTEYTIYLLANVPSIIAPRWTLVYYWPITQEYKADWESLDEVVEGTLEILRGNEVYARLTMEDYALIYRYGKPGEAIKFVAGEEAARAYTRWEEEIEAYWKALADYHRRRMEFEEALKRCLEEAAPCETLPVEPTPPSKPETYITPPEKGFFVNLPAGRYRLRIYGADGRVISESEKEVVVFQARREGVSYRVIPLSKWTFPETSNAPEEVLYVNSQTTIYVQPFYAQEYNELYYSRLRNPQDKSGRKDRWTWVPIKPISSTLVVSSPGQAEETINYAPYFVRQLPGSALGYEILDYEPNAMKHLRPSFWAYKVKIGTHSLFFKLVNPDGSVIPKSQREVRILATHRIKAVYLPVLLVFVASLGLLFYFRKRSYWRRRRLTSS
ncbi:MAG TPA: hypothetical protein ENG33_08095 [Chloroflexi bacterium]|nr:hypothetical protein [Chloroflexota bacterium]